jgi:alkaline phosphatase D
MPITRRRFLSGSSLALTAAPFVDLVRPLDAAAAQTASTRSGGVFRHGVASGDPRADRVILWTRVSGATGEVPVRWTLAANQAFTRGVARGETSTGAARDYTVKLDVAGLAPATSYYYRVEARGARSVVGGRRRPAAYRAGVVRQLPARLLQRLPAHRRAQ